MATERNRYESYKPPEDFFPTLKTLADEQRSELAQGGVELIGTDTRKHIFADFKNTRFFRQLYLELYRRAFVPMSGEEFGNLIDEFKGGVFEGLASLCLVSVRDLPNIVLSPSQTTKVYQGLYPNAEEMPHPFGETSLAGISVPDGLLVSSDNRVLRVYEYSLSYNLAYFEAKRRAFNTDKVKYPSIFSNADLAFVVPTDRFRKVRQEDDSIRLPFTRPQFRNFTDELLLHYSLGADCASVSDIQSEARRQLFHAENLDEGQITPEWLAYLKRRK